MSTRSTRRRRRILTAGAILLAVLGAACSGDDDTSDTAPASDPTTEEELETTAPEAETTSIDSDTTVAQAEEASIPVNVYWGWTVLNPASGSPERIGAGLRAVTGDDPLRSALDALLGGVDSVEQEIGMISSIPAGTEVLDASIDDPTATIDLSTEFEEPGGTLDESMRLAQIVFTATQFDTVDRVQFRIDGESRDLILSQGFTVGDGLTRDDFPDIRPTILVERPFPGAAVPNPFTIAGESNTFEATVRYAITAGGGDGILIAEGFTTATAGDGEWGTFEFEVDLSAVSEPVEGPGSIILWEDDPQTGEQTDIVEIPIVLPSL